jgi:hypothetical protein
MSLKITAPFDLTKDEVDFLQRCLTLKVRYSDLNERDSQLQLGLKRKLQWKLESKSKLSSGLTRKNSSDPPQL